MIQLVQHPFCGFIGRKSQFQTESGFRCPNCATDISEEKEFTDKSTYTTIGTSLECENGHRFVSPDITHLCPSCQAKFNHRESNYRLIYNYELTQKVSDLMGQEIDIDTVITRVRSSLNKKDI